MEFDPFLYVAFVAGFLAGRVVRYRSPWIPRATLATVVVLVGLLGATLSLVSPASLLTEIPSAVAFVAAILGATIGLYLVLARFGPSEGPGGVAPPPESRRRVPFSVGLLATLLAGYALGRLSGVDVTAAIPWVLYVLLALVGFDITLTLAGLKGVWIPLSAAIAGATIAGALFAVAGGVSVPAAFATSLGFGFYSLAGPLVTARLGAVLGLLAFLTNFLRENLTMLLAPYLGRRLRGGGLSAMGGATAMDTTLYFVTRYGDPKAGSLALAVGFILTLTATLALPALLALPA